MIKTVIFDMDNTIVKCSHLHVNSLNKALLSVSEKFLISEEDNKREFEALPTKRKLEMLTEKRGLPLDEHKKIHELKQKYTLEFIENDIEADTIMIELFARLKADGYKIYVASNSVRLTIEKMLAKLRLSEFVDHFISNEEVKCPKPNPEIFLKCMSHGSLTPSECLIVEDSFYGQKAAIDSGGNLMPVKNPKDVTVATVYHFIRLYLPFDFKNNEMHHPVNSVPAS
ncbi:MAG: HAD family phosphatase [Ginsengibacter sp.]